MFGMWLDIRYGLRSLARTPGITLIAILTLSLGIGANTTVFSVIYSVLLAPIPYPEADRLFSIWGTKLDRGWDMASLSEPNFWDLKEMNRGFENVAAIRTGSANLTGAGYPERLRTARVSAEFFRVLGVGPIDGRGFLPEEDDPGQQIKTALLAHHAWRARFGSDPQIVGKDLMLDGRPVTVVGVLPADRYWLDVADVFIPLVHNPDESRANNVHRVIGRLRSGVTREAALGDMEEVARRLEQLYPDVNDGMGIRFVPAAEWRATAGTRLTLVVLMGAVVFLLLIVCVNLANLLLARATGRDREMAVRHALGAGRVCIARRVLTESLLLGVVGAIAGLLFAVWGVALLKLYAAAAVPRVQDVTINGWVLGFTLLSALAVGVLAGLYPAITIPFDNVVGALRGGARGVGANRGQNRVRSLLVCSEVALSLMLLVGAGLMVRSFELVQDVELGFQSESRLAFRVNLPDGYRQRDAMRAFLTRFLDRLDDLPQVMAAAAVHVMPLAPGATDTGIVPEGRRGDPAAVILADWRLVTPDYFRTMGIPLLRGRGFTEQDELAQRIIIVSQALAEQLWVGEAPIGRRAFFDGREWTVVGVVGNLRERGLERDPTLAIYQPYYGSGWSPVNFVVHTAGDPGSVVPSVRSILTELDGNLPVSDVTTLDDLVAGSVAARRFNTLLLGVFSVVAFVLALAGIYGVLAFTVARRTAEIGVRVALGATAGKVLTQTVVQGMRPAAVGVVVGLVGAFGLSRFMSAMLFGIEPSDPITYATVALLLCAAAVVSCCVPAMRAAKVDPVTALREE